MPGYCENPCGDCPLVGKDEVAREVLDLMVDRFDLGAEDTLSWHEDLVVRTVADTVLLHKGVREGRWLLADAVVAAFQRTIFETETNVDSVCLENLWVRTGG
jgi:hypothetical protein